MTDPKELPEISGLPELMRFENGEPVRTANDWMRRRGEILDLYSEYVYGTMPDRNAETLAWSLEADPETGGTLLDITVSANGREASFPVLVGIPPSPAAEGGYPYYIEYWPWHYQNWFTKEWVTGFSGNCRYAMERGYAGIQYDCARVAEDNSSFSGAFYTLYPYSRENPAEQRGTLLAWAWGVSKVFDASEAGAGQALGIDPGKSLFGGVSSY